MRPWRKVRFGKGWISGVSAGLAYSAGMNVGLIRFIVVVLMLIGFPLSIVAYIAAAMLLPEWDTLPLDYDERVS